TETERLSTHLKSSTYVLHVLKRLASLGASLFNVVMIIYEMKLTPSYDMVVGIGRTGVYFSSLFMSLSKFIQSFFDFFCVNSKSNLSFSILYSVLQLEQRRQSSVVSEA